MSNQDLLTLDQATTTPKHGHLEFATHNASIRAGRHTFPNYDEFTRYLRQALGGRPDGRGIRGSMSRKGMYTRRAGNGIETVTLGDPVLDAISSPTGVLVIGDQTIDLREGRELSNAPSGAGSGVVVYDAPYLKFTGIVNGAERWASDDGALVQYRLGAGRLNFHAWKKHTIYGYWSMGGEISIQNTPAKFQAASIESHYYMSVDAPCQVVKVDSDSDSHDTYVDEYEWGWNAQQPERVASACRAVWHGMRFADLVTAGNGCDIYKNDNWPVGFPADWNTIGTVVNLNGNWTDGSSHSAVISVDFKALTVDMSAFGRPRAHGTVVDGTSINVTFPDDKTYTGQLQSPNKIRWSNGSVWMKVINTVFDLNGRWTDGSARSAVIFEGPSSIKVDMSDYDRPDAHGSIVNASTISMTFPDDKTYTGAIQSPNKIRWSNGSVWTKTA
ncbi:MAG: hypothetical protein WAV72_17685 [Bradyrhizobium sp.]